MSRPQVIDDEEHEQVHDRVAAIDVAKDTGMVCTRAPHPSRPGARRSTVWTVKARMGTVRALGRQLARDGIEIVTLESTSDYWRIWFFVLEACGLAVQLVNASQARNLPGRPKTDKLDAMWLARLTELGLLRASFVPPRAIRDLRDYTRARTRLVQERTRCFQRLEKLLEGALVKLSAVASKLTTVSAQDMIKAMIAGERDPAKLAALARTRMRARHDDLAEALDGMFDNHHGELAGLLLDHIAFLDERVAQLTARAAGLTAAMPEAWGVNGDGTTGPDAGTGPDAPVLNAVARLAEIPGISEDLARAIIAETGLDMSRFPTAAHLVSWAGLCPAARQSGPRTRAGKKGQGDTWLRGSLGQAATGAARTDTFLGERYHRIARRRGKAKAQVAVARSILVVIWHLLAGPAARFTDLGSGYYQARTDKDRKVKNHIRQIEALLGHPITITPKAA
ncbi:MAG: IS110 family transposase [Streptosporangiaceae bacterium]|nr:IS110 family transposase [Streptosporangiaceae bacterium]